MHVTKRIDLDVLMRELAAASVPVTVVGHYGTDTDGELFMSDPDGQVESVDLPPEAQPVVDAHVAPPLVIEFAGSQQVSSIVRTTDDVASEVFRFPTEPRHVYRATFRMTAIDAVSGATRDTEARMVFKHPTTTLVQVGTTAVLSNFADTATASWAILPSVVGTDLIISVRGAVGRTIDWLLVGDIGTYAPAGLTS